MKFIKKSHKIFVAGSEGMVGSAICRLLNQKGFNYKNKNLLINTRKELDLENEEQVMKWFSINKPDIVIIAAAKVGGILANQNSPVDFLLNNLKIQNNLIKASWEFGVKRLLFLGSSCIYPKFANQPIKEESLLSSYLEETNQWYAIAKISGIKLCEAFRKQYHFDAISLMPTNLYGPNDNYDLENGHVMAALIKKFYIAKRNKSKEVICWGTGSPLREFLYVEDFADACIFTLNNWFPDKTNAPKDINGNPLNWLNIGSSFEITIKSLAEKIAHIIEFEGKITWDKTKPDGTPRKKLDNTRINNLGWKSLTNLDDGIRKTIIYLKRELETNNI